MKIKIKKADINDLNWVNSQYEEVDFLPSNLIDEEVLIAEVDGEYAGLGRIQSVEEEYAELGGIYVLPAYRGLGLAKLIVESLLNNSKKYRSVYCLPFSHLEAFYNSFGFKDYSDLVPEKVREKHHWCNKNYTSRVLLLEKVFNS